MNRYDTPITDLTREVWNWPRLHEYKKGDPVSKTSEHLRERFMFRISTCAFQPYEAVRKVKNVSCPTGFKETTAYYLVATVRESVQFPGLFRVYCAGFDDGDFGFSDLSYKRKNYLIHLLTQKGRMTDLKYVFDEMERTKQPGESRY